MLFLTKKEKEKYLGFDDAWFIMFGIIGIGLFVPVAFFNYGFSGITFQEFTFRTLDTMFHGLVYWLGLRTFMVWTRKRFPDFEQTRKRYIYVGIFLLIYCGIAAMFLNSATCFFAPDLVPVTQVQNFTATYFISCFFVAVYETIYMYHQNEENLLIQAKMNQANIHSELQGLRNQVNPHFLFNSMNTLMSIIPEDQDLAINFLKKLSSVYRYILDKRDEHLVPLKDELRFAESYIFLQKERFKHKLEVSLEVSDFYLDKYILPLSVQILLENAIKHNELSDRYPLSIEIYVDTSENLVVKNTFRPKSQEFNSTKVGLDNIRNRLSYFTGVGMTISQTDSHFTVTVPLLLKNQKIKF